MKKILLLLIGLTIISCSSDDEDTRTTDPLIGIWDDDDVGEPCIPCFYKINANGTFNYSSPHISISGVWSNNGTDFNSLIQNYEFINNPSNINPDYYSYPEEITFSEDFTTMVKYQAPYKRR